MTFLAFVLLLSLGICLVPICFLRRPGYQRAQDYFVSSQYTPPDVVQNASIAYALRMATFGPFFAWGASGDLWPAIISSVFFGLGLYLIYFLRRPLLEFLDSALRHDRSITVHEFIAQQHANDPSVRLLASSLTIFAIAGLVVGEALGVAAFLKPLLPGSGASVDLLVFGTLLVMGLYAVVAGNSGAMQSAQLQLGILYLGLFGSTALLLYMSASEVRPMPPYGTFAILFVAACCAVQICYRRIKYIDTGPLREIDADGNDRDSAAMRLFRRFEKFLNVCICLFSVLVIVVAYIELSFAGFAAVARDSVAALQAGTRLSAVGVLALMLLPLFHPIVDITNWQRIAALTKRHAHEDEPRRRAAALRGLFRIYAVESPLLWLFMCMFGAIAVMATDTPAGADVVQAFMEQLASQENLVAALVLSLLLVGVFALALSTMTAMFSASLCTIRYDIVPTFWPASAAFEVQPLEEATARRRTIVAGAGLGLVIALGCYLADASLRISFTSSTFVALLFAFYCAQLSFAPLILGPIICQTGGTFKTVSPRWALVVLGFGAASGLGAVTLYLLTGTEPWLWASVPACLGSGFLLYAIARVWPRHAAPA